MQIECVVCARLCLVTSADDTLHVELLRFRLAIGFNSGKVKADADGLVKLICCPPVCWHRRVRLVKPAAGTCML